MILPQIDCITDNFNFPLSKVLIGLRLAGDDLRWFQWVFEVVLGGFCMIPGGQVL